MVKKSSSLSKDNRFKSPISRNNSMSYQDKSFDMTKKVTTRFQILGLIMIGAMILLLLRLFQVQIIQNEYYTRRLEIFNTRFQNVTTPRGEIFDRNGEILVNNFEQLMITYMPPLRVTNAEKWDLAYLFADNFEISTSSLRVRDLKDLFITLYNKEAESLISTSEWQRYWSKELSDMDIYSLKIDRITEEHLSRFDERTKAAYIVKQAMDVPTGGRSKVIKANVTKDEVAYLVEHIDMYRGFDIAINWAREYPQGLTLRSILGSVTTSTQGLPAERLLYYLALDYARNENIGRSGIELQYEELLKGSRSVYTLTYNESGLGQLNNVIEGSKGYDLKTSFDIEWQKHAEEVIKNTLINNAKNPNRKYMDTVYLVIMQPNTGDVLVMVGLKYTENGFIYDPATTYTQTLVPGSAIKGATLYMGLHEAVVRPNEYILDAPIKIRATPIKSSWRNLGLVNDIDAISLSSNVYMFNVAMRLGGATYSYDQYLNINADTFFLMRNYFSQFGLGIETQIDLPNEQTGYKGGSTSGGLLLDFAIGQYDTYTTMQLAQYVATIANNGIRVAPRVVLEAYAFGTKFVTYQNKVNILSILDDTKALQRVQLGFRECVTTGLCRGVLSRFKTPIAAKTGTAQATAFDGTSSPNSTLVAYAPYNKPEVAIACAIPNAWNTVNQPNICLDIVAEIMKFRYE